jgi:hypothetical protein
MKRTKEEKQVLEYQAKCESFAKMIGAKLHSYRVNTECSVIFDGQKHPRDISDHMINAVMETLKKR